MAQDVDGAREAEAAVIRRGTLPYRTLLAVALQRSPTDEAHCRIVLELLSTANSLRTALREFVSDLRLSELELGVLVSLFALEPDPGTPTKLREQIRCSGTAMIAALRWLQARALVRQRRKSGDRRTALVELTAAGRAATELLLMRFIDYASRVARHLPGDAAQACITVCHQLDATPPPVVRAKREQNLRLARSATPLRRKAACG
jgi:DNA-binding MarR family transcriptional regulator